MYPCTKAVKSRLASRSTDLEIPEQEQTQQPPQGPSKALQSPIRNSCEICEEGYSSGRVKSMAKLEEATLNKKLEQATQNNALFSRKTVCIYRVSRRLSESDKKAYVPQLVSLGPYHHSDVHLQQMDDHKWRAFRHVLLRTKHRQMDGHKWRAFRHVLLRKKHQLDHKHHFAAVRELEERARACYEEPISLGSNEFILMMLLDGCFVLELLQGVTENNGFIELGYSPNDPVFANHGPIVLLQQDMLMLENQLPLFVLERLLELQLGSAYKKGDAALLVAKFFCPLTLTPADESWPIEELLSITDSLHCLDVFRENILKKSWIEKDEDERSLLSGCPAQKQHLIHCVTKLEEVGIKFKKRETSRFWDIKFDRGVLEIPRLCIRYGTKSLLLNLIAFEQCHPECINNITSYVFFMGNLINSKKDVAYLHSRGIIEHWLGSDAEVVELFKCLSKEVVFYHSCSFLCKLSRDMNWYFGLKCKTWCASLEHKYLWAIFLLGVLTAYYFCIRSMKHMAITSQGESS